MRPSDIFTYHPCGVTVLWVILWMCKQKHIAKQYTEALLYPSKNTGLEINICSHHIEDCRIIPWHKDREESLKNVAKFKLFGTTAANMNFIHEETQRRLNLWNAC